MYSTPYRRVVVARAWASGNCREDARAVAEVRVRNYAAAAAEIHVRTADRPIPPTFRTERRSAGDVLGLCIDELLAQRRVVAGTAAECVEVLASLREDLRLTYVAANVCLTGLASAEVRRSMERLAADVVPHIRLGGARLAPAVDRPAGAS